MDKEDVHKQDDYEQEQMLTLPSGVALSIRGIRPDDASALQRIHSRCSERTIYLRFFGSLEELPDKKAKYFASTDGVNHFGLVALDPDDKNEIVGVVRFDREQDSEKAEYAALVEDRWQNQGVGTALTRLLIDEARDKGVRFFYALVKGGNQRMLELLRHLDLPEQEHQDTEPGVKRIEVELPLGERLS
ncbi:MAG TPA: GNAT family N-acetyltransferase, partial [Rubrobacteraceae bacterium]|nr:GNAT family N-acetyltransferase [Rubrobacteraceae bacterium]